MLVHIMTSENIYHISLIRFIERNFSNFQHKFIFRSNSFKRSNYKETTSIESRPNFISLILLLPQLIKSKKIYLHYLPYGPSLPFWAIYSMFSKKLVWVFWGGDIYIYTEKNINLKTRYYEFCRKVIIRNLKSISGFIKEDFDLICKVYSTKAVYTQTIYPLPIDFSTLLLSDNSDSGKAIQILAGNSGDPSNNHFDLLHLLEKYKDENILIVCPLSYGRDAEYSLRVKDEGYRIFGDKFKPLLKVLPPAEYSLVLKDIDIAVMNHQRQQGLGNLISLLYLEKKVFLRSDTTSNYFFRAENISVFDTIEIPKMDFTSFININHQDRIKNKDLVLKIFSESHFKELWEKLFSAV